jgi:hypothetical protein
MTIAPFGSSGEALVRGTFACSLGHAANEFEKAANRLREVPGLNMDAEPLSLVDANVYEALNTATAQAIQDANRGTKLLPEDGEDAADVIAYAKSASSELMRLRVYASIGELHAGTAQSTQLVLDANVNALRAAALRSSGVEESNPIHAGLIAERTASAAALESLDRTMDPSQKKIVEDLGGDPGWKAAVDAQRQELTETWQREREKANAERELKAMWHVPEYQWTSSAGQYGPDSRSINSGWNRSHP